MGLKKPAGHLPIFWRTYGLFLAPTSGDLQLSLILAPGDPMPLTLTSTCTHRQTDRQTDTYTCTHLKTKIFFRKAVCMCKCLLAHISGVHTAWPPRVGHSRGSLSGRQEQMVFITQFSGSASMLQLNDRIPLCLSVGELRISFSGQICKCSSSRKPCDCLLDSPMQLNSTQARVFTAEIFFFKKKKKDLATPN